MRAQIQAYEDLLDKHGLEPGEVALAWLLTRPGVTGPIVGPRTAEQLASALRAVELELSDELLAALDEIFPGPGPSPGGLRLVSGPGDRAGSAARRSARPGSSRRPRHDPTSSRERPADPVRVWPPATAAERGRHGHDDEQHGEHDRP